MKNYAKLGGRKGKPGYRTPSSFRYRSTIKNKNAVLRPANKKYDFNR